MGLLRRLRRLLLLLQRRMRLLRSAVRGERLNQKLKLRLIPHSKLFLTMLPHTHTLISHTHTAHMLHQRLSRPSRLLSQQAHTATHTTDTGTQDTSTESKQYTYTPLTELI